MAYITGSSGGAPTDADYLVGTADGSLSAEIVVGTAPAGELGGTWASPTVNATHSGSTHAATQAAAEATAAAALSGHEAAVDPHTGYLKESDANWVDLTDGGATTLHTHSGGAGQLELTFHSNAAGNVTMTNQANAEQFLANSNRNIKKADLTNYTQVRLLARVVTESASANNPRIYLEYHTSYTTTVGTYSTIGDTAVSCSLATAGFVDSGWVNLVSGAQADVFLAVLQNGGDAAADPAVAHVVAQFK